MFKFKKVTDSLHLGLTGLNKNVYSPARSQASIRNSALLISCLQHWSELVGPFVAEYCIPYRLVSNELYIAVNHPTMSQELGYLEQDLLLKIYQQIPALKKKIEKLKFITKLNFDFVAWKKTLEAEIPHPKNLAHQVEKQLFSPLQATHHLSSQTIVKLCAEIPDESLQEAFRKLAQQFQEN